MIDGGDAAVRAKWGGYRYFLVCVDAVSGYVVVVYMKDQSARSYVCALTVDQSKNLYGDFFSSHLDQNIFGAVRAEMGIEFEAAPPHMHWLNGYAEGSIRIILKIATKIRLLPWPLSPRAVNPGRADPSLTPPRAPANGRPGFSFGFMGAGGRLPKARRGRVWRRAS